VIWMLSAWVLGFLAGYVVALWNASDRDA